MVYSGDMLFLRKKLDGMHVFYVNGMLRSLVFALVSIFTPVYLYKIGLSQWGSLQDGLLLVCGYYILTRVTTLLFALPISWVIEKIGFRHSMATSLLILIGSFVALLMAEHNPWLVAVASVAGGLNIPFYWVARNSAISQDSNSKLVGSQMGIMTTVEQVATLLGPLAAGLMIEKWGFASLYLLALVILGISVIPLWGMPHHVHKNGATWIGFWQWIRNPRYTHIGIGVGARAVDDYAISILWPLSIFVLGVNTGVLGGVFSLVAVVALVMKLVMGKVFDRLHAKGDFSDEILFMFSACINSIAWIIRIFMVSVGSILLLDAVGAITRTIYSSFYLDYEQLGGKRMGSIAYWVYGEMMYSVMTIALFGVVALGVWAQVWRETFMIMAGVWVLVSMVMAKESNMK